MTRRGMKSRYFCLPCVQTSQVLTFYKQIFAWKYLCISHRIVTSKDVLEIFSCTKIAQQLQNVLVRKRAQPGKATEETTNEKSRV
mmetsp:Transcript_19666/g.65448  ORF Transcript_19666/g.65448 Transcript_19666/m.65448 type:complete len:85 (-) Transcript_19666:1690-1944(-)